MIIGIKKLTGIVFTFTLQIILAVPSMSKHTTNLNKDTTEEKFENEDWQNPLIFGINKLPSRNPAWPNPIAKAGWKSDYEHSPWVLSLDGDWLFKWSLNPSLRPKDFYKPTFKTTAWKTIPVPSC